ncbi:MAG TPA: bifunctional nuclease family protein [Planctomycetaceae bacterium]|nr:bifunctional nuclease family protein [Planctomycetaceae bacterium]
MTRGPQTPVPDDNTQPPDSLTADPGAASRADVRSDGPSAQIRSLRSKFRERYNRSVPAFRESYQVYSSLTGELPVLVRMELARIVISDVSNEQIIYLREVDGQRMFPILIGLFEATSIDRRVKGEIPTRPLTHDLLKNTIQELGGEVQDVVINNLMDHTYYAVVRVRASGQLMEIDSRPSDAIALSVHFDPVLPIYVEDSVLGEVA